MGIQEQFNRIAEEYDRNRRKFIPCFDDFYVHSTDFITANINTPKRVVDLGAGTGLLSYYWYQQFPESQYVLVDIADEMLNVAKKRFSGIADFEYRVTDYTDELPEEDFDTVISALSVHHLEDGKKQDLFSRIYERLPEGGLFANYDQFCAGQPEMNTWYDTYWEGRLYNTGLSEQDIEAWQERRKLDRECSVEAEIKMLQECNYRVVKCIYTYQKFSVVIAIK